jgi:hypothetical protein
MSIIIRSRHLARAAGSVVAAAIALGGFSGVARAVTPVPNTSLSCQNVVIKSTANQKYVSAEVGGADYAMLAADSATVGSLQQFSECYDPQTGAISFRSNANGLWVSAELTYGGNNYAELRARATTIGPWERYRLVGSAGGVVAMESLANQQYVSAEILYQSPYADLLRARSASVGPWEQFTVTPLTPAVSTDTGWVSYDGGCQARTQLLYWAGSNVASVDTQVKDPYWFAACRVNATLIFDTPAGPSSGPTQAAMACAVLDPSCASSTDTGWQTFNNAFQGGVQIINDIRVNLTKG